MTHADQSRLVTTGTGRTDRSRLSGLVFAAILAASPGVDATAAEPSGAMDMRSEQVSGHADSVERLINEALAHSPELAAARFEAEAARQRIAPAAALDDPMLELGVLNAPVNSFSLRREDMTMKMLGFSQKLPFPGKRDLRRSVATAQSEGANLAAQENTNKVVRDVRIAYEDLVFNAEARRILSRTEMTLEQLVAITDSRHHVGQASQSDVIEAQTELGRLRVTRLQLERDGQVLQSQLRRLLGRSGDEQAIDVGQPMLRPALETEPDPRTEALANRPQLLALKSATERYSSALELAQREYYPDFDVRLSYGQRERSLDGLPRDDMVSLTVAVNLPIWRKSRLEPQVAEARAMRNEAQAMLRAQQLETTAALDEQLAATHQWQESAELYRTTLHPQARAAVASALAAYQVGKVDFLTLRQAEMRELETGTRHAEAIANYNKARAEIDLLVGRSWRDSK